MDWWKIFRRESETENDDQPTPEQPAAPEFDEETRIRRRRRLEQRIRNLQYDIAQAKSAMERSNRWTRRVEELDAAIGQAREDAARLQEPPGGETPVTLPRTPVEIIEVKGEMPSDVRFQIGGEQFRYSEEIDWSERGEQRAEVMLRRFAGDVSKLLPDETPEDRREELRAHLAHSLASLAVMLRDDALEGRTSAEYTLYDLAYPCPNCDSWRDLHDRCLQCQRREWRVAGIQQEINRLLDERGEQLDEAARWREALPILQRQLQSAQQEIEKYS